MEQPNPPAGLSCGKPFLREIEVGKVKVAAIATVSGSLTKTFAPFQNLEVFNCLCPRQTRERGQFYVACGPLLPVQIRQAKYVASCTARSLPFGISLPTPSTFIHAAPEKISARCRYLARSTQHLLVARQG